jgi:hypothetical protein
MQRWKLLWGSCGVWKKVSGYYWSFFCFFEKYSRMEVTNIRT